MDHSTDKLHQIATELEDKGWKGLKPFILAIRTIANELEDKHDIKPASTPPSPTTLSDERLRAICVACFSAGFLASREGFNAQILSSSKAPKFYDDVPYGFAEKETWGHWVLSNATFIALQDEALKRLHL